MSEVKTNKISSLASNNDITLNPDGTGKVVVTSTETGASSGPKLDLKRDSSAPADGDAIGRIRFIHENDADEAVTGAQLDARIVDASDGTEDGRLIMQTRVGGSLRSRIDMLNTEFVINQESQDINFRIESDDDENMFFLDAGSNSVGFRHTYVPSSAVFYALDPDVSGTSGEKGWLFRTDGRVYHSTNSGTSMFMNDSSSSSGTHNYIVFRYAGSSIGDIDTTNNSTMRYNTFTGGHWCQFSDLSQPNLKVGTVLSSINEMCKWTEFEFADENGAVEKTSIAGTFEIGSTHTIYIDEDGAQAQGTAVSHDTSQRVVKVKVSDVAGDRSVYGVFAGHYKDGDSSVESLGLGIVRIGSGVTVSNGDLLESAGDGTARPQTGANAELYKAGTIAKVTSTVVVETYDDGSYTVPCTLHCG
tara:strand:- start:269 stop:1519 length:1251 start_codon:yes stop_codon:yes gene_type:complete